MRLPIVAVVFLVCSTASQSRAQDTAIVREGDHVRLRQQVDFGGRRLEGRLVGFSGDSVVLLACETCRLDVVPLGAATEVQIRTIGLDASVGSSIRWGLSAAAVSSAWWLWLIHEQTRTCHDGPCGVGVVYTPAVALAGFSIGLAARSVIPSVRWRPAMLRRP